VGGPLEAPFAILFTSRTTGRPNGVVVDQRSVKQGAVAWLADVGPAPGTAFLNACPLLHGSVLIALSYLAAGATVCVLDAFSAAGCLAALQRWKVEHTFLVPAMVATLLASAELRSADLDALRLVLHGAPPMPPALAGAATEALGADLQTIFGVTEAGGPVVSLGPRDRPLAAPVRGGVCVGRPMLGVDLRVVGPDGTPLGAGEVGRLHLSGDGLMRGYWKNPEATAEVLHDGWLDTRDLACVGLDGYVWCWTGPVT
jgi:acyl-CoA synthetase (AMP-forming)/AMP-acid ligase II